MPKLKITVEAVHTDVLPGEELWLEAGVTNVDVEPVLLPQMPSQAPSPFRFELHNDETGELAYAVSQEDYRIAMAGDDIIVFDPPENVEVQPDKKLSVTEDIASYATEGFAPGQYRVKGFYKLNGDEFAAEPVLIRISRPQIGHMDRIYCSALGVFSNVFENLSFEGNVTLYQRETHTANPENGVFRRRINTEGTRSFDDLATAAYTYWEGEGRWFAWLTEKKICGAKSWGHALTAQCEPFEIGLENAKFVEPAFQLEDETALFPIVGTHGDAAHVQFAKLDYERCLTTSPAPLCSFRPSRVLGRFDASNDSAPVTLIWSEQAGGVNRIYTRRYTVDGRSADDAPRQVYERPSPLLALEADDFLESAEGDEGYVHALFGPEDPEDEEITRQQVIYIVIDPAQPTRPAYIRRLTLPEAPIDTWSIASIKNSVHVVVGRSEGKLLWATPESNNWQLLKGGVEKIERLRLFAADERVWAQWLEPRVGLHSILVPVS